MKQKGYMKGGAAIDVSNLSVPQKESMVAMKLQEAVNLAQYINFPIESLNRELMSNMVANIVIETMSDKNQMNVFLEAVNKEDQPMMIGLLDEPMMKEITTRLLKAVEAGFEKFFSELKVPHELVLAQSLEEFLQHQHEGTKQ